MTKSAKVMSAIALSLFCVVVGIFAVGYGAWVDEKLIRIVLVPGVVVLLAIFLMDKSAVFLLILLVRAPIDPLLEATRMGPLSGGALMNLLMLLIAVMFFIQQPRVVSRTVLPMWLPLILIMAFETARAPEMLQGIRTFLSFATNMAVFMIPFYMKQFKVNMRFCIRLVLLSSIVPALYGFVDYARGGMGGVYGNRMASTLGHPNIFAFYLVLVISMTLYLLKSPNMKTTLLERWVYPAWMGVLMVLLVLTQTRSAWTACLVMFVVYGLLFERRYLVYICVVSMLALLVPAVQDRLLDLDSGNVYWSYGQATNSLEWRQMLWRSAIEFMQVQYYPLGYGLGAFAYHSAQFFPLSNGGHWSAHSVYYQWFFEAGIVGLLCAAWLYFRLFNFLRTGLAADRLGTVVAITVTVEYLVVSYSDNMLDYLAFNWYFWFFLGSACSMIAAHKDLISDNSKCDALDPSSGISTSAVILKRN